MSAAAFFRYAIAWLGFVAMGYGLTLMFMDRDAHETGATPPALSDDATIADDAGSNDAAPRETATINDATGARVQDIDIALASLGGPERTLSEWAGKPLVVNFWATWCAPCRKEIPLLKALQTEYADEDLTVIGVAIDEMDAVTLYNNDADFNYPVLVGEDSGYRMASAIGVKNFYVPITAFVGRDGAVKRIHTGEIHREDAEFAISEIVAR